jgi:hypothetical protein
MPTRAKSKLDPRQAHGSAYGMVAAQRGYHHPTGEWNFQEVTVKGSTIKVELNGTVILDCDLAKVDPATFMGNHPHPGKDRTSGFLVSPDTTILSPSGQCESRGCRRRAPFTFGPDGFFR